MKLAAVIIAVCLASPALSQTALKPDLAGVGFLVGHWTSDDGKVADTGQTSKGSSLITVEANGEALLRRDHTDLFGAKGAAAGGFDQIMLIYPDGGSLRADYTDGVHVIHYASVAVMAGKSVTFTSAPQMSAPTFQLRYEMQTPNVIAVTFAMIPPGQTALHPIAAGTLKRSE